jgi:predicted nucleotidyltransferase
MEGRGRLMIEQIDFEDLPISELKAAKTAKGKGMKILYISCVGSHMWRMESKESDIDLVMIYTVSTRRILRGEKFPVAIRQEMVARRGGIYDTLGWEIGHLIDLLIKGNINAIWYATSPLVIMPSALQEELSAIFSCGSA